MKKFIGLILISFLINSYNLKGQGFNNTYELVNKGLLLQRALEMDSCYIMSNNVSGVGYPLLNDHEIFFKLNKDDTL